MARAGKDRTLNFSRNLALWAIIALLVFALFNLFQGTSPRTAQSSMAFSDFITAVEQGDVREVTIQGHTINGQYRDGRIFQTYAPDDPNLVETLRKEGVRIRAVPSDEGSPTLFSILLSWFPMLLLIGVWIFFMRQMQSGGGKAMGFGKSKARMLTEKQGRITFDDVAGIDEAKQEI
jgi:cell division protease FtsH